jgi:membrane protease YdiL (CAAX protease family)
MLFLLVWAVVWLPIAIPLARLVKWHPAAPISTGQKLTLLASLYLIAPFMVWLATKVEGASLAKYGLAWQVNLLQSILFGLGSGIATILLIYLMESGWDWLQWQPENFPRLWTLAWPLLAVALSVSIIEELVFRGLFVNELLQDYSMWIAATISSLIFALLHLIWERENTLPQLPGLWLMGMVLVGARLVAGGSLGLAIGLHTGWVFSLACLDTAELYVYTGKGGSWLTGKQGQPLASVAGVMVLLFAAGILVLFKHYTFNQF